MSGRSRIACASSGIKRLDVPMPPRTPPVLMLPGKMVIMFVPADLICSSICAWAPVPMATIAMTAATPMIIPSIVKAVRILLRPSALNAIRSVINMDIGSISAGASS